LDVASQSMWRSIVIDAVSRDQLDGFIATDADALARALEYVAAYSGEVAKEVIDTGIVANVVWKKVKRTVDPREYLKL